jgi:hypothetical protein
MTWGGIQSLYYDDSDDNIGDISKFGRRIVASLAASMLLFPSNIIVSTAIVLQITVATKSCYGGIQTCVLPDQGGG